MRKGLGEAEREGRELRHAEGDRFATAARTGGSEQPRYPEIETWYLLLARRWGVLSLTVAAPFVLAVNWSITNQAQQPLDQRIHLIRRRCTGCNAKAVEPAHRAKTIHRMTLLARSQISRPGRETEIGKAGL